MFRRNGLADILYPIASQDVNFYEDWLKNNINILTLTNVDEKDSDLMFTSRWTFSPQANLLYWNGHYAPSQITKGCLATSLN